MSANRYRSRVVSRQRRGAKSESSLTSLTALENKALFECSPPDCGPTNARPVRPFSAHYQAYVGYREAIDRNACSIWKAGYVNLYMIDNTQ